MMKLGEHEREMVGVLFFKSTEWFLSGCYDRVFVFPPGSFACKCKHMKWRNFHTHTKNYKKIKSLDVSPAIIMVI